MDYEIRVIATVTRADGRLSLAIAVSERLEAFDQSGAVVAPEETSWALRWTFRQEMTWLPQLCGFQPVEQWSDFHGAPPAYGKEQVWVARAA